MIKLSKKIVIISIIHQFNIPYNIFLTLKIVKSHFLNISQFWNIFKLLDCRQNYENYFYKKYRKCFLIRPKNIVVDPW